jgi:hypothetical protein
MWWKCISSYNTCCLTAREENVSETFGHKKGAKPDAGKIHAEQVHESDFSPDQTHESGAPSAYMLKLSMCYRMKWLLKGFYKNQN